MGCCFDDLGGDQGLLRLESSICLQSVGHSSNGRSLELLLGRRREVGGRVLRSGRSGLLLDGVWGGRSATGVANQLLRLGRVVSNVLLGGIGRASSMVAGNLLDLLSLLVDDVGDVGKVVVDELLVGLVEEGAEEDGRGRDQGKTPERNDLDKEVGEEGAEESLRPVSRFS